jgi:hypothetical protein
VPSRVIHQRQLYGDQSDGFVFLAWVFFLYFEKKKPDQAA